jgi:fission process protein 1
MDESSEYLFNLLEYFLVASVLIITLELNSCHLPLYSSTDTPARYLGLVARIRPLLIPASRYLAYTSDVGEAFRPVVNPKVVTTAYGISIAYVVSATFSPRGARPYSAQADYAATAVRWAM